MRQPRTAGAQSSGSVLAVAKSYMEQRVAKLGVPLLLFTELNKHGSLCLLDAE